MSKEQMMVLVEIGDCELECVCEFDYQPAQLGRYYDLPENCYPDEPEDFDPYSLVYTDQEQITHDLSYAIPCLNTGLDNAFDLWKQEGNND